MCVHLRYYRMYAFCYVLGCLFLAKFLEKINRIKVLGFGLFLYGMATIDFGLVKAVENK